MEIRDSVISSASYSFKQIWKRRKPGVRNTTFMPMVRSMLPALASVTIQLRREIPNSELNIALDDFYRNIQ